MEICLKKLNGKHDAPEEGCPVRLLLQLPSARVLALLRVPQLLLPQVPVRLVRRRRDELAAQLQSKKMQRPGQVTQVPLLQWSTQAHQPMLFGNRRSRLQPLPPLLSPRQWRRAPPRPTQRARPRPPLFRRCPRSRVSSISGALGSDIGTRPRPGRRAEG